MLRADYRVVRSDEPRHVVWEQELEGGPFERLLSRAQTDIEIEPAADGATVTIVLDQKLRGWSRLGAWMFRRAARQQLDAALGGLEGVVVR